MSKIILTWTFKKVPHISSTYIDTTENVLKYCHPKSPPKSNLVPAEKYIYTATNKDDIIIIEEKHIFKRITCKIITISKIYQKHCYDMEWLFS